MFEVKELISLKKVKLKETRFLSLQDKKKDKILHVSLLGWLGLFTCLFIFPLLLFDQRGYGAKDKKKVSKQPPLFMLAFSVFQDLQPTSRTPKIVFLLTVSFSY